MVEQTPVSVYIAFLIYALARVIVIILAVVKLR